MLNRILPDRIDNHFRGHTLAIWFLIPITFIKIAISLLHIFRADGGAQSISTIPLATYSRGAAQNVIALFARMGLDKNREQSSAVNLRLHRSISNDNPNY